jgi:hypothetical protein
MDGTLQVWDTRSWSLVAEHRAHDSLIRVLAFDAEGRRVATAGGDHVVKLWDVATLTELERLPSDDEVASIDIDRQGRLFEFGNTIYRTNVWQLPEPYRGSSAELATYVACVGSKVVLDGALVAVEPGGWNGLALPRYSGCRSR